MLNYIVSLAKKTLKKEETYKKLANLYNIFFNPFFLFAPFKTFKKLKHNIKKDLNFNEKEFQNLEFNLDKIKIDLKKNGWDYYNKHISWHFHFFAGLSQKYKDNIKILEIGSLRGETTSFLSNIYPNAEIITCDMPTNADEYTNYGMNKNSFKKEFFESREKNLKKNNIKMIEINSIFLIDKFAEKEFDLIWIDGDHVNPQVTIDIIQCKILLKDNGMILCDDIIKQNVSFWGANNDSYQTLEYLKKVNFFKTNYIVKRINKQNAIVKKYISYSKK